MNMSFYRIKAILLQEYYITRNSLEIIIDLFFFSVMSVVVFGFVSRFLSESVNSAAAYYLFMGILLWEIIRISQYSMSVGALWNIWSRNLSNMFITPLSLKEFLLSQMISATLKTLLMFILVSFISAIIFNFNMLSIGFVNLLLSFVNLLIFSWTIGIVILGLIFRYGTRIQALAWGAIFLFQPLTAAFFPVKILPGFLQTIAYTLPPTYVFEAARNALTNSSVDWNLALTAFLLNIFYFSVSIWFFNFMFKKSKDTGQFARMEG